MYPSVSTRQGTSRSASVDSACSVVTPEEMLKSEQVGGISHGLDQRVT